MAERILAIDDNQVLLRLVRLSLETAGFVVSTASSGEEGLRMFHQIGPDLVILDVMMPAMDGWEVCRRLRQVSSVPIMFLTALDSVEDVVHGLMSGADDYLTKPFVMEELVARVTALLRRARMPHKAPDVLRFGNGDLVINRTEQTIFVRGQEVSLSPIEYNLLLFMAERAGHILSPDQIFQTIWGGVTNASPESVKWYIWRLRQKVEPDPQDPRFILTERGKGYRFSPQ